MPRDMQWARKHMADHGGLWLVALLAILALRAIIPAGYMPSTGSMTLAVQLCSDPTGTLQPVHIQVPVEKQDQGEKPEHRADAQPCAFSILSMNALGAVDGPVLLAAIAYQVQLGFRQRVFAPIAEPEHRLPPYRGPPAALAR